MKISPCFTHPQGILDVYDFLLSDEYKEFYKKIVLALPSFIMAVGGCFCSTVQKKSNKAHPSVIKRASHGSGGEPWIRLQTRHNSTRDFQKD